MPVKRRAIAERESRTVRLDFGDAGDLNVAYFPGKLTYGLMKRINNAAHDNDYDTMLEGFLAIFDSWDLLDDNGNPEPLTMAVFEDLGVDVLTGIMSAIQEQENPKAATPTS